MEKHEKRKVVAMVVVVVVVIVAVVRAQAGCMSLDAHSPLE